MRELIEPKVSRFLTIDDFGEPEPEHTGIRTSVKMCRSFSEGFPGGLFQRASISAPHVPKESDRKLFATFWAYNLILYLACEETYSHSFSRPLYLKTIHPTVIMHFNLSTVLILATAILSVNASPSPAESLSIVEHSLPASVACAASGAVAPEAEEDHGVETDGEEETWEEVVDQEREKRENKMKQNGVKRDGSGSDHQGLLWQ
ncbi:uncharacterized protein L3040_008391 [Drepanopeziza brunnea f. sp. 'multigermtubi']|uniref:uncharacterized protein n=1 Tax=Drepanopeziza brunnea f. sp. 'multigermtubi' TaxID=698441 RepID=UPI0023866E95|nr:hypothetical protein L3040_008391 [Drepanopeziza brunnea f. sp. 'multigermtubi']